MVHIAKEVNIEHMLGSKAVTFSLRSVATGESVDPADRINSDDNLILMPNTPLLGGISSNNRSIKKIGYLIRRLLFYSRPN